MNLWYLCLHSHKVINSAYLWESSGKTGGCYCIKPLFWLCPRFREVSQVDTAFVQKVKHSFQAPGQLIKWHGVLSSHSFLNHPLLGPTLFCNTEKSLYSFGRCLAIFHSWNIALLTVTSRLWDSTERPCVYIWPRYSHSCHFKCCFFVLCWCPPFLHRLQQQSAVPEAIFDYTLLRLNLQETGVLIQGDSLSQGIARVYLWLELKACHSVSA